MNRDDTEMLEKVLIEIMEKAKEEYRESDYRAKLKLYVSREQQPLIDKIKKEHLKLLEKWLVSGFELIDFYRIEQNGLDIELAFEMQQINKLLK